MRSSFNSVLRLFTAVVILIVAFVTLTWLDDVKPRHGAPQVEIDSNLLYRLDATSPPAGKAARVLLRLGKTSFATEDAFIVALSEHAPGNTTEEEKTTNACLFTQVNAIDTKLPGIAEAILREPDDPKTRQTEVVRLAQLTQSRAALVQIQRARSAEARAAAKQGIENARRRIRAALPQATDQGGGLFSKLRAHIADERRPLHLAYDIAWYTALLAGVLAIAFLIWTLVLRAIPFGNAHERFDNKIADWLKGDPSRSGGIGIGKAVASMALVAVSGATVAHGIGSLESSPWNESSIEVPVFTSSTDIEAPNSTSVAVDLRDTLTELRNLTTAVQSLNSTASIAATAVGTVATHINQVNETLKPVATAAPQMRTDLAQVREVVSGNVPQMKADITEIKGSNADVRQFSAETRNSAAVIARNMEQLPEQVEQKANAAAGTVVACLHDTEKTLDKSIDDSSSDTQTGAAIHASHRWWRRLIWIDKYQVSPIAIAALERAAPEVGAAAKKLTGEDPMYRSIFLDRIAAEMTGDTPADKRDKLKQHVPLLLALCRTAE